MKKRYLYCFEKQKRKNGRFEKIDFQNKMSFRINEARLLVGIVNGGASQKV